MKPKAEVAELIEHWYVLVAGQHFSTKDFYYEIETRIKGQCRELRSTGLT